MIIAGLAVGFAGEATKDLWTSSPETSGLGDMDCDIKLSLCASIASVGAIGGARTSLVPSPDLDVKTFFKRKTPNGKATGFGEGIWNIEHHPVIYVVKDAFWSDKPEFSCAETRNVNGRKAYQLTLDPDKFGIRLISFMDPSSIGGIKINPNVLPQQVTSLQVAATHGILGWGTNGYTDDFRSAIGLDYTVPDLSPKEGGFQSNDSDAGFKLIHKNHDDVIFKQAIPEDEKDYAAYRLSQYTVSGNIHRRMYGLSTYYTKKNAGPNDIDNVNAVAEPQVFLPADTDNRLLFGPEAPDFVVTAMLRVEGKQEDGQDHILVHSLRYIPQIKYVGLNELLGIYSKMVSNAAAMKAAHPDIAFPEMDAQLARIKVLIDNAK